MQLVWGLTPCLGAQVMAVTSICWGEEQPAMPRAFCPHITLQPLQREGQQLVLELPLYACLVLDEAPSVNSDLTQRPHTTDQGWEVT